MSNAIVTHDNQTLRIFVMDQHMEIPVDARDMQPPEPFEATMTALDQLKDIDDEVVLWIGRYPEPLFNVLRRNGYQWAEASGPEGCFEIRIRRKETPPGS